jgi:acetyl-CoA C-acetyltransferase
MTRHGQARIVAIRRTAIGRAGGIFRTRTVDQLAGPVIRAVLAETGLPADGVDAVWLGNILEGGNVARRCALAGGLPSAAPAFTLERQCTSALDAICHAIALVDAGHADAVLAGGVESCSTAPWRVARPTSPTAMPVFMARAPQSVPPYADPDPLPAADALAHAAGIDRPSQDAWTARSHANGLAATDAGVFDGELVGVFDASRPETDEGPKRALMQRRLARFKPLNGPCGTATAGSTAPEADGAVVALVVSSARATALELTGPALRLDGLAQSGCDPACPGYAAVPAMQKLGVAANGDTLARIEFNEAFAGQTLACLQDVGVSHDRVNLNGGALAFGHPYGASGAYLVCRLFHDLADGQTGLAALSAMGAQGTAALFTRLAGRDTD